MDLSLSWMVLSALNLVNLVSPVNASLSFGAEPEPDYYSIAVFNEAFGGGFSSRLFNDIRTKRGLAYNVGGGIGTNFGHAGVLQFVVGTKSQSTIESVLALNEDIEDLTKKPITDGEIKQAKDAILNAFIFRLDSPDKVLGERMTYEFYGYPPDFLERYRAGIEKVGREDVARTAAKELHKDKLAVLVIGNTADFDKPLSSLGAVTQLDISIPPPPSEIPSVTRPPESAATVAACIAAIAGVRPASCMMPVPRRMRVVRAAM